jgi:hypothetical protein
VRQGRGRVERLPFIVLDFQFKYHHFEANETVRNSYNWFFVVTNPSTGFDMFQNSIVNSPNERSRRNGFERSALLRSDSISFRAIFTGSEIST